MKLKLLLLVLIISKITSNAQKFEGIIIVKTEASKYIANTSIIDKSVPPIIDTIRYYVKDEKFLKEYLTKKARVYQLGSELFMVDDLSKNTLFDINSKFLIMQQDGLSNNLKKTNSNENILGFDCKKYKYKNALHSEKESKKVWISKEWDFMHTFDGVFIKDLGLVFKLEGKFGSSNVGGVYQETVIDVIETVINNELFELPNYPIEKVDMAKISKAFINENK